MKHLLDQSNVVVDVGSNRGQFIDSILSSVECSIIAIEPEPMSFSILKSKYRAHKNIELFSVALGEDNAMGQLQIANNDGQSSSLLNFSNLHLLGAPKINMVQEASVEIRRFSDLLHFKPGSKIFIKIDVQGYELHVLKGISEEHWNMIFAIRLECNLVETYIGAAKIEDVFALLRKKGLVPYRIEPGFGMPDFGQQLQMEVLFKRIN